MHAVRSCFCFRSFVACALPLGLGLSWFPGWFWHLQALRSLPFWGSLHVVATTFQTLCRGLVCRLAVYTVYSSMHRQQALHHNTILTWGWRCFKIHQNLGLWWSVWSILGNMFISIMLGVLRSPFVPLRLLQDTTHKLHVFISHNWATPRFIKFMVTRRGLSF